MNDLRRPAPTGPIIAPTWLRTALPAAAFFILIAAQAIAIVDPNFTPVHVHKGADLICVVSVASVDDEKGATLTVGEIIKGAAPAKTIRLDFAAAAAKDDGPAAVKDAAALLRAAADHPVLLIMGGYQDRKCGFLHAEAAWMRIDPTDKPGVISLVQVDARLNATFNGGTDMLIRTMQFITKYPGLPIMACIAGTEWSDFVKVGAVPGRATTVQALDVNGDGRLDIFVASDKGDRLFLAAPDRKFVELKLESANAAAAWADFDADGRPDLASLSKDGLRIFLQTEPGKFKPLDVPLHGKPSTASLTLDVIDADADGKPDLVAGIGHPEVLLNDGRAKFNAIGPVSPAESDLGLPGPCVAADFDNDGRAEILQVHERGGRLFIIHGPDKVDVRPVPAAVMGKATERRAALADFDGDGLLDVILAGGGRTPHLLQNRGRLAFEQVMHLTGEPGYIIQANAACIAPGDFNADSFLDLFVGCEPAKRAQSRFFFNRGFRSFAICEPLKLDPELVDGAEAGQPAAVWADLDASGSDDLIVALGDGSVYWCITKVGEMQPPLGLRVRVADKSAWCGPLVLTVHSKDRCLGARMTRKFAAPALMNVPEPGRYEIRYTGPDGKRASKTVDIEDKTVDLVVGE